MQESIQKAAVLIEALPYIREFWGKTVVVKYGGSAMLDPKLRQSTAEDIVLMKYVGMNPVVVHGGGPAISETLKNSGIETKFHNGLRITDGDTISVVEMVLAGRINKDIVALLNRAGGRAVGVCGKDGNLLHARQIELEDGFDIGQVGEVTKVDPRLIGVLSEQGYIPVIAPLATDEHGATWNVNADTAAGEIAAALEAEKLVFLTDTPGLLRNKNNPDTLMAQVETKEVARLIEEGALSGGMIPKVKACIKALESGVRKTHIIDGRVAHALLLEIFTKRGMGSLVCS